MRKSAFALLILSCPMLVQAQPRPHHSSGAKLFLARASGAQVVPRVASAASATAVLILDVRRRQIRYEITYSGLERAPASRIALYNFDTGGNGAQVALLCGRSARACPGGSGARLSGTLPTRRWRGPLLGELASGRIYVQVDGSGGRPEIRGQLAANMAMVASRTYLARLAPSGEPGAAGAGTAVLSETYLPDDQVAVEYHVTVTGTTGTPEAASLVAVRGPSLAAFRLLRLEPLPNRREGPPARTRDGATFAGGYKVASAAAAPQLVNFMLANTQRPVLAIKTSRFPNGELFGEFVPVE
jgi:hypothetical protein